MLKVKDGQCGKCAHFGEQHPSDNQLTQIRIRGEAPEDYVDQCGLPAHASLHLELSANSHCDGFTPAVAA